LFPAINGAMLNAKVTSAASNGRQFALMLFAKNADLEAAYLPIYDFAGGGSSTEQLRILGARVEASPAIFGGPKPYYVCTTTNWADLNSSNNIWMATVGGVSASTGLSGLPMLITRNAQFSGGNLSTFTGVEPDRNSLFAGKYLITVAVDGAVRKMPVTSTVADDFYNLISATAMTNDILSP